MFDFVARHSELINVVLNIGMLVVWVCYLQIFVHGYRRQRRSALLITRGSSHSKARCIVTNMGAEQVYVTSLVGRFITGDDSYEFTLTDLRELSGDTEGDPRTTMLQGSLDTGQSFDLGPFVNIIEHMRRRETGKAEHDKIDAFELTVVALYGSEELPVGARRRFAFPADEEGGYAIRPDTIQTRQLRSRSERRALLKKLEEHLSR